MAIDTPAALKASVGTDIVTLLTNDDAAARAQVRRVFGIDGDLTPEGLRLDVRDGEAFVPRVFEHLTVGVQNVNVRRPSLDDVFLKYTGRGIRDADQDAVAQSKARMGAMARRG